MKEADGEFLDTLYRLIDVDKGLDKIPPDTKLISEVRRRLGMNGPRARLCIAKHLDKHSSCEERPFLSWSKTLQGVLSFLEKKKEMINTDPERLKLASSQIVVAIDLHACRTAGIYKPGTFVDLSSEDKFDNYVLHSGTKENEWTRQGQFIRGFGSMQTVRSCLR